MIPSLLEAAMGLMPLLDRTLLKLRYSQEVPGLSTLEYKILDYVCYHEPVRVGDIAMMSGLEFPNASIYVRDMVKKGLLKSARDPRDKRALLVKTDSAGKTLLNTIETAILEEGRQLAEKLDPIQQKALLDACRQLSDALKPLIAILEDQK